mmetsp:Transcript_113679/g.306814  ORF Transcript_113679/g.306814 Transcript_113679/m.306814 type:complete len:318 (-) Transcript_113679:13-966(-)
MPLVLLSFRRQGMQREREGRSVEAAFELEDQRLFRPMEEHEQLQRDAFALPRQMSALSERRQGVQGPPFRKVQAVQCLVVGRDGSLPIHEDQRAPLQLGLPIADDHRCSTSDLFRRQAAKLPREILVLAQGHARREVRVVDVLLVTVVDQLGLLGAAGGVAGLIVGTILEQAGDLFYGRGSFNGAKGVAIIRCELTALRSMPPRVVLPGDDSVGGRARVATLWASLHDGFQRANPQRSDVRRPTRAAAHLPPSPTPKVPHPPTPARAHTPARPRLCVGAGARTCTARNGAAGENGAGQAAAKTEAGPRKGAASMRGG